MVLTPSELLAGLPAYGAELTPYDKRAHWHYNASAWADTPGTPLM